MKSKILIVRFSSLGDIILTSSAVANIKIAIPDSYITYLCKEQFKNAVELIDGVDEIVTIPNKIALLPYLKRLLELNKSKFDYIIDLHGNLRSWWSKKIISAKIKTVYPKRRMARTLAVKKKIFEENSPHTIDLYNAALKNINVKAIATRPVLKPKYKLADDEISYFQNNNNRYIVIAPGAAHPTKQWPPEKFIETAEKIHQSKNVGVIWAVTSSENNNFESAKIPEAAQLKLVDCPIDRLAAVMSQAALTIANDSGIGHLSSGVATPVISIFGPTHPILGFVPRGLFDTTIHTGESCSPCSLHGKKECYREERFCFTRIVPEFISRTAVKLLDENLKSNRAVFIDRDGTIIVDKNFISDPNEIEFETGTVAGLQKIKMLGYKVIIISNQSGVARGYFNTEKVDIINASLIEKLAKEDVMIDAVYFCPHYQNGTTSPYNIECNCRKPAAGMVEEAAAQFGIDMYQSFVIGDKMTDINLSRVIGANAILVKTGYGMEHVETINSIGYYKDVAIADNLLMASEIIESSGNWKN